MPGDDAPAFESDQSAEGAEDALTDALAFCYAHLTRREHSVAELRERLERARMKPAAIEDALATVVEQGYLSDERYARQLAEDRRAIDGWGIERIRARMQGAGIDQGLIDLTLASFDEANERVAAIGVLRRRFAAPPGNDRERQRAFAMLIRQGFDSDVAYDAIREHGRDRDGDDLDLAS